MGKSNTTGNKPDDLSFFGWLNWYIFQWMFFRVFKEYDKTSTGGQGKLMSVGILFPIIPKTGWDTMYRPFNLKTFTLPLRRRKVYK